MSFVIDTSVTSINDGFSNAANTYTWTHTVTGSDPLLVLCVSWTSVPGDGSHVSAATYGGTTLTKVDTQTEANSLNASTMVTEMWYMQAPPTGSATMSVTISIGSTWDRKLVSVSYTGAKQSGVLEQSTKLGQQTANPSINLTTTNPGDLLITAFGHFPTTQDPTSNQTVIYNDATGTNTAGAASYQIVGNLGTYSDTYTTVGTTNTANALVMAAFINDSPATTTSTSSSTSSTSISSTSSSTSISTTSNSTSSTSSSTSSTSYSSSSSTSLSTSTTLPTTDIRTKPRIKQMSFR